MRTASLALAGALAAAPLRAQTPTPPADPKAEPVAAKPADATPPPPDGKPPTVEAGADGFVIQSGDGDYRLQFRAYAQFDGRFFVQNDAGVPTSQFLLRRVRPILQGTLAKHFDFNLTPDFGAGNTVLQDAYVEVRYTPKARLRIGKFKVPLGLERLQSATAISFVERAFPTSLVPNRDVGAELIGDLGGGIVSYAACVSNGAHDGGSVDVDTSGGKDVSGRLFVSPFKKGDSVLKDLGIGIAGSVGDQSGPMPTYRSSTQLPIVNFPPDVTADGSRQRLVPQLSFYAGPFGLMAEYARSDGFAKKGSTGQRTEVKTTAWQTTATWTLTGERASFSGVKPKSPFDPDLDRWGALELVARVNGFELGDEAFTAGLVDPARSVRDAFAWGVGLNWYLNRNFKQVVSYEHTTYTGGGGNGGDREDENALFIRAQISF
jgi:phosphate-selective porin OprO/OprP